MITNNNEIIALSLLKPKIIVSFLLLCILIASLAIVPRHQVVMDCKRPMVGRNSLAPSKATIPNTYRFTETLLGSRYVEERTLTQLGWTQFCDNNYAPHFSISEKIKVGDLYARCSWRDKNDERNRYAETELDFFNKKLIFYYWENVESWTDLDDSEFTQEHTRCSVRDEYHLRVFY